MDLQLEQANLLISELSSGQKQQVSDGYHTFGQLYETRCALTAALFNTLHKTKTAVVSKSWRHHDQELCFGGGWFVVQAQLDTGQISFHYEERFWDFFDIPEVTDGYEWDGHTTDDVINRLFAL